MNELRVFSRSHVIIKLQYGLHDLDSVTVVVALWADVKVIFGFVVAVSAVGDAVPAACDSCAVHLLSLLHRRSYLKRTFPFQIPLT